MSYTKREISKRDLAILCRQLAFVLNSGISISEAVAILAKHYENKRISRYLNLIHKDILTGKSFSQSLHDCSGYFPRLVVAMTKAGENSGSVDIVMLRLADYYETEEKFISSMRQAMIYPSLVCVMMLGVLFLAMVFVIPGYSEIFSESGAELPFLTRVMIALSSFVVSNFWFLMLAFIVLSVLLKGFLSTKKGKYFFGRLVFCIPIYVLRVNFVFAQTLSILLSSGLNIVFAVESAKDALHNKFLDSKFDLMTKKMRDGHGITQSIEESNLFNSVMISMLSVGESGGNLSDVMSHCEKYFRAELERKLESVQKLIEPVLTIVVGIILGIIIIAVMEPTFTMSDIL